MERVATFVIIAGVLLICPTRADAKSTVHHIRPDTISTMNNPVELTCEEENGELFFTIWAGGTPGHPAFRGELQLKEDGRVLMRTPVKNHPYQDGQAWSFTVSSSVVDSTTFSIGRQGDGSVLAWIFYLGPLLKKSFRSTIESPRVLPNPCEVVACGEVQFENEPYRLLSLGFPDE
jgi:hypothetical protein